MLRRTLLTIVILLSALSVLAFRPPSDYMQHGTVETGDALVLTGGGYYYGIMATLDGTNDVTFAVYDNTSATGTKFHGDIICTTTSDNRTCAFGFEPPLPAGTGIYVDVTVGGGGSVTFTTYYRAK
jgi:hypothetical protein